MAAIGSGESILATLQINPKAIKSMRLPWKRSTYQAIINWLSQYRATPNQSNLEQVRGCLEAFELLCTLEAWDKAAHLFLTHRYRHTGEQAEHYLGYQLGIWGYYQEQINLCQKLLGRLNPLADSRWLNTLGNAHCFLSHYAQAIDYHQP